MEEKPQRRLSELCILAYLMSARESSETNVVDLNRYTSFSVSSQTQMIVQSKMCPCITLRLVRHFSALYSVSHPLDTTWDLQEASNLKESVRREVLVIVTLFFFRRYLTLSLTCLTYTPECFVGCSVYRSNIATPFTVTITFVLDWSRFQLDVVVKVFMCSFLFWHNTIRSGLIWFDLSYINSKLYYFFDVLWVHCI